MKTLKLEKFFIQIYCPSLFGKMIERNGKQGRLVLLLGASLLSHYEELRTIKGKVFPTFHSAAIELGLMDDEKELDRPLDEAASLQFGDTLRNFFMSLLIYLKPSNPLKLWEDHKDQLAADWTKTKTPKEATNMCWFG